MQPAEAHDIWANAGVLIASVVAALSGYYWKRFFGKADEAKPNSLITGIGVGWLDQLQTERLLGAAEAQAAAQLRIAVAVETMADKRTADMAETLKETAEKIDAMFADQQVKPRRR